MFPMTMVRTEAIGDVLLIEINNPPINAGSLGVRQGLMAAIGQLAADPALRAGVLIGGGSTFVAGSDLREFGQPLQEPQLPAVLAAIEACAKPVVAALHGAALGGGLELALACDARIALAGTVLGLPEVMLGIIPGAGGTQRLPRAVGKAKAMDLCLTARMMDAAEAEKSGLVARVIPADQLMDETMKAAQTIAGYSLPVIMMIKESVNRAYESSLNEGLLFERRVFHSAFALEDQKEGMAAFVEKRKPAFKNR
jgi:enoyl-CoA hydratase